MQRSIAVVLPCLNEAAAIADVVDAFRAALPQIRCSRGIVRTVTIGDDKNVRVDSCKCSPDRVPLAADRLEDDCRTYIS